MRLFVLAVIMFSVVGIFGQDSKAAADQSNNAQTELLLKAIRGPQQPKAAKRIKPKVVTKTRTVYLPAPAAASTSISPDQLAKAVEDGVKSGIASAQSGITQPTQPTIVNTSLLRWPESMFEWFLFLIIGGAIVALAASLIYLMFREVLNPQNNNVNTANANATIKVLNQVADSQNRVAVTNTEIAQAIVLMANNPRLVQPINHYNTTYNVSRGAILAMPRSHVGVGAAKPAPNYRKRSNRKSNRYEAQSEKFQGRVDSKNGKHAKANV